MSDFAGLWRLDGRPVEDADLDRLARGLEGRGIGRPRIWRNGSVALVHRQHVFTPQDAYERMPRSGASGSVLVADVRLDNRAELAERLNLSGADPRLPDGEIILRALECWGDAAVPRLYGDFALALWQPDERRFLLARDAQIHRSLFIHRGPRLIAFSTRLRPLLSLPEIPLDLDELAVADRLILHPSRRERTQYRAIDRLPMGHFMVVTADGSRSTQWWSLPQAGSRRFARAEDTVAAAQDVLDRAVAGTLRAVGPVGCCLTGGLDSTAIVLSARKQLDPDRLLALTRAPDGPSAPDGPYHYQNEVPRAAALAAMYPDLDWHAVPDDGGDWGEWDRRRWFLEAGVASENPLNFAWFFPLFRFLAARGGRVLLGGEMGNLFFSFGGTTPEIALLRQGRLIEAWRLMRARSRAEQKSLLSVIRRRLLAPFEPWWLRRRRRGWPAERWGFCAALNPEFAAEHRLRERLDLSRYRMRTGMPPVLPREVQEFVLLDDAACDGAGPIRAMHGLQFRSPLADRRLIEFFAALPPESFVEDGMPRALARRTLAGRAPEVTVNGLARGRQHADWFTILSARRPGMLATLARARTSPLARRMVDLDRLQRILDDWPANAAAAELKRLTYFFTLTRGLEMAEFLAWREGGNG